MADKGILMHISSLPSPYGIGSLGQKAYEFVDFLKDAGKPCGKSCRRIRRDTATRLIRVRPHLPGIRILLISIR